MQAKKSGLFSYFSEMVHIMLFNGHMNDEQWTRKKERKKSIPFSCYRNDPTHEKRTPIPIFSCSNKWLLICIHAAEDTCSVHFGNYCMCVDRVIDGRCVSVCEQATCCCTSHDTQQSACTDIMWNLSLSRSHTHTVRDTLPNILIVGSVSDEWVPIDPKTYKGVN